jgi:hypothetical protein
MVWDSMSAEDTRRNQAIIQSRLVSSALKNARLNDLIKEG